MLPLTVATVNCVMKKIVAEEFDRGNMVIAEPNKSNTKVGSTLSMTHFTLLCWYNTVDSGCLAHLVN